MGATKVHGFSSCGTGLLYYAFITPILRLYYANEDFSKKPCWRKKFIGGGVYEVIQYTLESRAAPRAASIPSISQLVGQHHFIIMDTPSRMLLSRAGDRWSTGKAKRGFAIL